MSEPELYYTLPCACTDCQATAAEFRGWLVCTTHGTWAGNHLAQLSGEYERMAAVPSSSARTGDVVTGGPLKHTRSPANLDVIVARDWRSRLPGEFDPDANSAPAVLGFVLGYAEAVRLGRELTRQVERRRPDGLLELVTAPAVPVGTFTEARRRLVGNLDWMLGQEWAGQFCDELHELHAALRRLNSAPVRQRRSTCRKVVDGGRCGGVLSWDGESAVCARCEGKWSGLDVLRPNRKVG